MDRIYCGKCGLLLRGSPDDGWTAIGSWKPGHLQPWLGACPGSLANLKQYPTFDEYWEVVRTKMDMRIDTYHEPEDPLVRLVRETEGAGQ